MSDEKMTGSDRAARERIVDAAIELFATVPVGMTTVNAIARKAGVKQPLLMYHFKSKDRLYHEVLMKAAEELGGELRGFFDEFDRHNIFTKHEAQKLLSGVIHALINSMYPDPRHKGHAWLRILLFEIYYPTECFQELYTGFLSRFYVMVTGLIMSINGRYDYETAVLQWMQISGLIVGFQAEKEIIKRVTGFRGDNFKEREKLKALVVRNALMLLESQE